MESSTVQEFPNFRGQKIAACSFEMCQLQIVFFRNPKQRLAELSTAGYRGGLHQELHSLHWCHWWAAMDVLGMTIENRRINWKTASHFTSAFGQGMTWSRNIMLKLGSKDQWSYSPPGMCVPRPSGKHHHYPDIGWFPGDSWCLSKVRLMIFFATAWWKSWAPWKCTVPGTIFGPSCRIGQFFMDLMNPKIQKNRFQWIVSGRSSLRWIF